MQQQEHNSEGKPPFFAYSRWSQGLFLIGFVDDILARQRHRKATIVTLLALAGAVGSGILVLTAFLVVPMVRGSIAEAEEKEQKIELPAFNVQAWHGWPVLHNGRIKPFESAARESVLQITGRSQFAGQDAVALVLTWRLLKGGNAGPGQVDWNEYPFIRCDLRALREQLQTDVAARHQQQGKRLPPDWVDGKYISPADLQESPEFRKILREVAEIRQREGEKAQHVMSPAQRKAAEVESRLGDYYALTQNAPNMPGQPRDPFNVVALDKVPGGGWLSVAKLREIQINPEKWNEMMRERVAETPQRYVPPECQAELEKFQARLKAGTGIQAVEEMPPLVAAENEALVAAFRQRHKEKQADARQLLQDPIFSLLNSAQNEDLIRKLVKHEDNSAVLDVEATAKALSEKLAETSRGRIDQLRQDVAAVKGMRYRPDDPNYRMLHLNFLETRYPDFYRRSQAWQEYPKEDVERVLTSYDAVRQAYLSGKPEQFAEASTAWFTTLREVSQKYDPDYPNVKTLALEQTFNHAHPFQWGWIIMLGALGLFIASMAVKSRPLYTLAFVFYLASLAFQIFGFYARVSISGRAPVSNMYETVIWVAFMSAVFALVLELIYRRKVIGLAGSLVAVLGLVLADNTVLDPTLSPLQPVLRSNFWLTIHVLTIVSSYAGGTLGWALGNVTLALMAFGNPRRDLLHTLAYYTKRAMEIAVILLAIGTFLGAWWAADSWGRYWGWDPKEVWALIALVVYVIPLHARYIGWVKDFTLAVSAVLCYSAIVMSWYGVNFVLGAGLHSYGFGGGGPWWVFWGGLINVEWVILASLLYLWRTGSVEPVTRFEPEAIVPPGPQVSSTGYMEGLPS